MKTTLDETETLRRQLTERINVLPGSREALEAKHGQVWDSSELQRDYEIIGFAAPLIVVTRKCDGQRGSLCFQHSPRLYFGFQAA